MCSKSNVHFSENTAVLHRYGFSASDSFLFWCQIHDFSRVVSLRPSKALWVESKTSCYSLQEKVLLCLWGVWRHGTFTQGKKGTLSIAYYLHAWLQIFDGLKPPLSVAQCHISRKWIKIGLQEKQKHTWTHKQETRLGWEPCEKTLSVDWVGLLLKQQVWRPWQRVDREWFALGGWWSCSAELMVLGGELGWKSHSVVCC